MTAGVIQIVADRETSYDLPPLKINEYGEDIYGVSFEVRSTPSVTIHAEGFAVYQADNQCLQSEKVRNMHYDMQFEKDWNRLTADEEWRTMRVEAFVKSNAAALVYTLKLLGTGDVSIRNLVLVKGGFPDNPMMAGAPYLDWVQNLQAYPEYERPLSALKVTRDEWPQHLQGYMELSPDTLYKLVPERRGLGKYHKDYTWDPREPDVIRNRTTGEMVDYRKEFPVSGEEEVRSPSGKTWMYTYHLRHRPRAVEDIYMFVPAYPGPDEQDLIRYFDPEFEKIYLDKFMVSTRMECFDEAALVLAQYYTAMGDMEAGLRAAIILLKQMQHIRDWPLYGYPDWNYRNIEGFFPPDDYGRWFAWIADGYRWYTVAAGNQLAKLVTVFEHIKDDRVWSHVADTIGVREGRKAVTDGILHIMRMSLKMDAYHRTHSWKFLHNTMGLQLKGFVTAGLSIGCPEIIHYVIRKAQSAFTYLFMADGMFPESVSYLHDVAGQIGDALTDIIGYSDPAGYSGAYDNQRIYAFAPEEEIPNYRAVMFLCNRRLFYPDGSAMTIHDTWAESQYSQYHIEGHRDHEVNEPNPLRSDTAEPFLLPEFGHAILGSGSGPDCMEGHLHYSGHYNHSHEDMLNFTLWAYGDELASDLGYSHLGGYQKTAISHNLVVIDGNNQSCDSRSGNLLQWHAPHESTMFMQAEAPGIAYRAAGTYRRAIISIPIGGSRHVFLDLFEVKGGSRHEWMANGCADYSQLAHMSLEPCFWLDNLDERGTPFVPEKSSVAGSYFEKPLPSDGEEAGSHYYGAFRNVKKYRNDKPWQLTMTAACPNGEEFPGAGARAKSGEEKPGLRIHWLASGEGEVLLCDSPRQRYNKELAHLQEAMDNWTENVMPKVIVRREGEELESTFAALWEPFRTEPVIRSCQRMMEMNEKDGIGVVIESEQMTVHVLYRNPDSERHISTRDFETDAALLTCREIKRIDGRERCIDLYDGMRLKLETLTLELVPWDKLILHATGTDEGGHYLLLEGNLEGYPDERDRQPHKGKHVALSQAGQPTRYLPVEKLIALGHQHYKMYIARHIGFDYDPKQQLAHETFFPHRTIRGPIQVTLPTSLHARIVENGQHKKLMLRSESDVMVSIPELGQPAKVIHCSHAGGDWKEVIY